MNNKQAAKERFNEAVESLPYHVVCGIDDDEIVLDGRYTFGQLTMIYEAWIKYREETLTPPAMP